MSKKIQDEIKDIPKRQGLNGKYSRAKVRSKDVETAPETNPEIIDIPRIPDDKKWMVNLARLDAEPDATMSVICSFVSNGGSIINLIKTWDVPYPEVLAWIRKDKERARKYEQALSDRSEWTIEQLLTQLRNIAMFDIRQIYDQDNNLKPVTEWPPEAAQAVEAIKVDEIYEGYGAERTQVGETKQVKLWSKIKAIELLGKNLKLFIDHIEHSGSLKLEDLVGGSD